MAGIGVGVEKAVNPLVDGLNATMLPAAVGKPSNGISAWPLSPDIWDREYASRAPFVDVKLPNWGPAE